jgi:2,3-bisphosphoglycerate-independent phosphoglycerate mutase
MTRVTVPAAKDFFASATGVGVYVEVRKIAIRVTFATVDAIGETRLGDTPDCQEASRVATAALRAHREQLLPLFDKVARERGTRTP